MLNSRVYTIGGHIFQICGYFGLIPYTWDQKNLILQICPKTRRKSRFILWLLISWTLFVILDCSRLYRKRDFKNFNICLMFLIAACLGFIPVAILRWPNDAGLHMFNSTFNYSRYIRKPYACFTKYKYFNFLNILKTKISLKLFRTSQVAIIPNQASELQNANDVL